MQASSETEKSERSIYEPFASASFHVKAHSDGRLVFARACSRVGATEDTRYLVSKLRSTPKILEN